MIDFIETRNRHCSDQVLKEGLQLLSPLLINPILLLGILTHEDRRFSPSYLLRDLAKKIKRAHTLSPELAISLDKLYARCFTGILDKCINNMVDLIRCINAMPTYEEKILEAVLSNNNGILERILNAPMTGGCQKAIHEMVHEMRPGLKVKLVQACEKLEFMDWEDTTDERSLVLN